MSKRRCLVIGASGQLGRALCTVLRESTEVLEGYRAPTRPGQLQTDLTDPIGIQESIRELKPDWILIAGAFCNVDLCEAEQERCWMVNVKGPAKVCETASQLGSVVVYYSTDQVFPGGKEAFQESDPVYPLNVYASSKVEGERLVKEILPYSHLILRTTCLYGPDDARRNFVLRLVDRLNRGEQVRVPQDQWAAPTFTEDLAHLTCFLLERGVGGLLHATGPEFMSRCSWAMEICKVFGLDPALVVPTLTKQLGQLAQRPLGVRLDCRKLTRLNPPGFRRLKEGLEALRKWDDAESPCLDSHSYV